jgi:hypothetical protein
MSLQFAFLMLYFINGLMASWHVKSALESNPSVHNIELTCLSETIIYGFKFCWLLASASIFSTLAPGTDVARGLATKSVACFNFMLTLQLINALLHSHFE